MSETESQAMDSGQAMQKHRTAFEEMKMNLIHSGLYKQCAGEKAYSSIPRA